MAAKKKNAAKGLTKRGLKRSVIIASAAAGGVLLVVLALYLGRPKLLWYVDEEYTAAWNRVLNAGRPPFSRHQVVSRPANALFPAGRFGFIVTRCGPAGERAEGAPVALYRDLARTRVYQDWHVLALDPWMVFRKHQDPEPGRSFLDLSNGRGSLLLAGLDEEAVRAWLFQLLQESPGVFPQDEDSWQRKSEGLAREYPFQNGAFSYSWVQTWPLLFRSEAACLYAPLSQARSLPPFRIGLLDATRFPEPAGWDRYGMQAEILWAKIQGDAKQREKIAGVERWLRDAATQTVIANIFEWIPAHPSGIPFNTVSWESQMAWLRSSYIWQGADDAQDS